VNRWHRGAVALAAGALLAAGCGGEPDDDAPRGWIADHYERASDGSGAYLDSRNAPNLVADAITGERAAQDRIDYDDRVFLHYDDDMVAVIRRTDAAGSRIEIADYATGYRQWNSYVGSHWPSSQGNGGSDFRGGGPGSGK
jgi:hypothetical protein